MNDPLTASEDGLSGEEVMAQRNAFRNSFAADKWYPWLQGETFDSVFVPVTYQQGWSVLICQIPLTKAVCNSRQRRCFAETRDMLQAHEMDEEECAAWSDLLDRLELARLTFGSDQFFAKLGTRSGKDAVLYGFKEKQLREEFGARIKRMKTRSAEADGQAFIAAQTLIMRLSSVAEAIEMFAWSFRISADLAAEQAAGEGKFLMNIVLRRWNDDVVERSQWEFRGFVSKGKLTAITQYFSICYFEELSRNEAAICKKLVEYHDSIKERIQPHLASYGIDFFIASDGSVMVIELNPFYTSLGAGLFDWKADMQLLTNGLGGATVIRVLQHQVGSEHAAYEWLPLRWFKWLHATHPCDASKCWAISQGLWVEHPEQGAKEKACVIS